MAAQRSQGGSRAVALLNIGVVILVVAIVAAVALVVSPPAPPGIAEFAPEASKAIVKAPLAQSAVLGAGPSGACAAGQSCSGAAKKTPPPKASAKPSAKPSMSAAAVASTTGPPASASAAPSTAPTTEAPKPKPTVPATLAPVGVPSSLQCYQWPDGSVTQTGDPQSPPCVATWDVAAGNGGATSMGVTGSEIDVAVPFGEFYSGTAVPDIISFLNSHFEFYGRTIKLIDYEPSRASDEDPSAQHADGQAVTSMMPFATTELDPDGNDTEFVDAVTQSHIVYVGDTPGVKTSSDLAGLAPYAYSYGPAVDTVEKNLAEYYCKNLAGKNAVYGGADVAGKPRKVALLYPDGSREAAAPYSVLVDALSACGVTATPTEFTANDTANDSAAQQLMLKLEQQGYTTMIQNGGLTDDTEDLEMAASSNGYTPEWIVTGIGDSYQGSDGGANEEGHTFGLAVTNKVLPTAQQPFYEAVTSVDPSGGYSTNNSGEQPFYRELLLIASGIQLAGPHLTPFTFQKGLQEAQFPNPGAGAAPSYQSTVGFGSGFSMTQDTGLWWESASQPAADTGAPATTIGSQCWVNKGARYALGSWPGNLTPFSGACR